MKKVTKAVIAAAGLGTRMLPISHAVPKEMLPIVDLPAIYYLVRETVDSGITDILIVTHRDKESIEDFFDISHEYREALLAKGKENELKKLVEISEMANISYIRQLTPNGLANAVLKAEAFAGEDPFIVLYGDDIIFSDIPVSRQLIDVYNKHGMAVVGVKSVDKSALSKYCSLKVEREFCNGEYFITDMIEKPKPGEEFSNLAILGRVLLTKDIFKEIKNLKVGYGGEYQLTDAMANLARSCGVVACEFSGERFDLGSKIGFLTANVREGLRHKETAEEFKKFLKDIIGEL